MSPNYNCSDGSSYPNQSLGFFLCLLVVAYIYYFHTSSHHHLIPLQEQTQHLTDATTVTTLSTPTANANFDNVTRTPYDRGYHDGMKACSCFGVADMIQTKREIEKKDHDLRELVRTMEKKLYDFGRECEQVDSIMKKWKEEYLRVLWEEKQKGETGLLTGWFKSPRASVTMLKGARGEVVKVGNGRAEEKTDVRYGDGIKKVKWGGR